MSQSGPAEPIVTSSDKVAGLPDGLAEPSPPLGELAAAIREYVSAEQLGENNRRRNDLSRRVFELCWTCRPKWHKHEMRCTDGTTAHVVWTYSAISVQYKTPEGGQVGGSRKPRRQSDPPSKLDQELDDIELDITRARHESAFGKRALDENGRPLPAPATDRLLVIADRIELQQASDRPVLSEPASAAYEILLELPSHRGLTGTQLIDALRGRHICIEQSTLTSRIVPELEPYGIENAPRKGYRIPLSKRPGQMQH